MKCIIPLNSTEICKEYLWRAVLASWLLQILSFLREKKTNKRGKITEMEVETVAAYFKERRVYITAKTIEAFITTW